MSKNLPQVQQVKKKGWLSRLFSRTDIVKSTPDFSAVTEDAGDQNKAKALENMRKLAEGIHAKTASKCRTSRYVSAEAGDLDGGVYLYAFRNPLAGTWNINRYSYVPELGFKCEPVKEGICYWDVLEYCGAFEGLQKSYGKTPALDELEEEAKAPHYAEMAEAEGIPLDLEGMPLLTLEGEIVSPGLYDKKAVEVARRGAVSPPVPKAKTQQIRKMVQQAFHDAQLVSDDLQRILRKTDDAKEFKSLANNLAIVFDKCKAIQEQGRNYSHQREASQHMGYAMTTLRELAMEPGCPADMKAALKKIGTKAEYEFSVFMAKWTYKDIIQDQQAYLRRDFEELCKKIEGFIGEKPELAVSADAVRTYIMDCDAPSEMPRFIGEMAQMMKDVSDALHQNIEEDNRTSVQRGYRLKDLKQF